MTEHLIGNAEMTVLVFVLAGLYYTCGGWIKRIYRRAQGEAVPIDWEKFRNAVITGASLGGIAYAAILLKIIEPPGINDHLEFGALFAIATTIVLTVDRFLLTTPSGPRKKSRGGMNDDDAVAAAAVAMT